MGIIDRLNERLNYNKEMQILFASLSLTFIIMFRFINDDSGFIIFLMLAVFFLGMGASYHIYKRDDDRAYGYYIRDKIRKLFGRPK